MSPESSQATHRRTSYAGHGNRSSGSPRHNNRGGNYRQSRASPKSLFQQQNQAASPSRSPRHSSVIGMVTKVDSANNNGSTTLGVIELSGSTSSFAGSKFNEAPHPDLLPPPPAHWLSNGISVNAINQNIAIARHLKSVLNIPVQS